MSKKKADVGLDEGALTLINNITSAMNDDVVEEVIGFNKMENDANVKLIDLQLLEDAPLEWNFYKPLPDSKFQSMKESIIEDGLYHPILVWEIEDGKRYMILSGHNRKRAYQELYEETGEDIYKRISAKVIRTRTMTEKKAKAIVSMGNYAQRNVSPSEEFEALKSIYLYNKDEMKIKRKRENYEKIQEQTGKDLTSIIRILNLDRLIPELFDMVGGDKPISWVSAQRLVTLSEEDQRWLYDNFKDKLNSKTVSKIRKWMERDTISKIFEEKENRYKGISLYIPKTLEKEVRKLIRQWEKRNQTSWDVSVQTDTND
jgi:ParB family chromosome partitioning protein